MTQHPHPTKNDTIGITLREAPTKPAEDTPTTNEHLAAALVEKHKHQAHWPEPAAVARDRLREAMKEAFPRSQQYRPAGDGDGNVGSDAE